MKIINGERASGRTTLLIQEAARTGARIVCNNIEHRKNIMSRAEEMGAKIKEPVIDFGFPVPFDKKTFEGETLLIDDAEQIIGKALSAYFGAPVATVTINCPKVLKSVISDEAREVVKKNLGEQHKEEFPG